MATISKNRFQSVADDVKVKAAEAGLDVTKELVSDAVSLEEAYLMGRYEQIQSFIAEIESIEEDEEV